MNKILIILSIVISSLLASGNLYSNNQARALYFTIDLKKNVGSTTWIYIQKGFEEARKANANTIVIEMNTNGGEVVKFEFEFSEG